MLSSVWWVETTERCNLRCQFCYNGWRSSSPSTHRDVAFGGLTNALRDIACTFTDSRFVLSGGDASVREDFQRLVARAASLAPTSLVTNGETLDRSVLARTAVDGVADIQFSVHSHREKTHKVLTGGGVLQNTLRAINDAVSLGFNVSMVMVLTERNIDDIYGITYLASRLGVNTVVLNPVISSGRAVRYQSSLAIGRPVERVYELLGEAKQSAERLGVQLRLGSPFRDRSLNALFGGSPDKLTKMKLVLDTSLNVKPCSSSSYAFGHLDNIISAPELLEARYLKFWSSGQPMDGCVCRELHASKIEVKVGRVSAA